MQSTNKKKFLIVLIIVGALGLSFLLVSKLSTPKKPKLTGEYYDANSGQTVSNPTDTTPDDYGSEYPDTSFIGFGQLLTHGLSSGQLELTKKGLNEYNTTGGKKYSQLSFTSNSVSTTTDGNGGMNFDMVADRTVKLQVQLTYPNLDSVSITVLKDGKSEFKKDYIADTSSNDETDDL